MKNQRFDQRLGYAISGLASAWRNESSFRYQCGATIGVLILLAWRQPSMLWWAVLLITCAMVLAAELFNSALEAALDHLHPERHPAVGVAKDCAAGAVLLLSMASVAVLAAFLADTFGLLR